MSLDQLKIAIIGLGYVGLPLAATSANGRFSGGNQLAQDRF